MTQQPRFCEQCGAPCRPDARFCRSCGHPLQPPLSFQQNSLTVIPPKALDMVICYAHEDENLQNKLVTQLSILQRQGLISIWNDRSINAGKEWEHEIAVHLNKARIILLLVSPDFIRSEYCYSTEMLRTIERYERGDVCAIPIILRPVHWQNTPLGKLQALPTDGRPVIDSSWHSLDEAFYNVAEGIRKVIESLDNADKSRDPMQLLLKILEDVKSSQEDKLQPNKLKYIGRQLGDYRLIRLLGAGGFAEVYIGEHIHSGIQVAVKILPGPLIGDAAEEFLQETRKFARLIHPNIVRIIDFDVRDMIPFIIMDYASKGSLREHCPKGTRIPLSTVISYVNQIAGALQYAHEKRFVHGDLKPENILLGPRNEVWLSDFNLEVDTISKTNPLDEMAATIPYMAPEQFNGIRKPASDQYALGIIVYELLCGYRPFSGSVSEIMAQHVMARPPALRDKVKVPPSVESIIMKALAKDPNRRFNSVRDFATSLERASSTGT